MLKLMLILGSCLQEGNQKITNTINVVITAYSMGGEENVSERCVNIALIGLTLA